MHKPFGISWPAYIRYGLIKRSRFFVHNFYRLVLLTTPVYKDINDFKKEIKNYSQFRGTYKRYAKYYLIYKLVRQLRPKYILECGCGLSTIIIARAIKENGQGAI